MRLRFALPGMRLRRAAGAMALLIGPIIAALPARVASLRMEVGRAGVDAGNVIESFQIERDGDFILLPVTVNDEEFQFVVDTGSSICVVDAALEKHLTPTGQVARINGRSDNPLFSIRDAFVGEARLPIPGPVICRDLSEMRRVSGHEIRGFLGMSFLRSHIIEVNFDAGELRVLKSATGASGAAVPIRFDAHCCPTIDVQLDSSPAVPFLIDTGCVSQNAVYIKTAEFDTMLERGRLNLIGPGFLSMGIHGIEGHREARIGRVKVDEFEHRDLLVGDDRPNALTLEYVSRFRVLFDFPNSRAYFEPGERYHDEAVRNASGLLFERVNGETKVCAARARSPAALAGILAGDCITAVDKMPVQALSMHQLRRIFSTEDRDVYVTVRRDEQVLRLEVHLPPLLDRPVID